MEYDNESTLNLTLSMTVEDGRLRPFLTWNNPSVCAARKNKLLQYQVVLSINSCEECNSPSDYFAEIATVNCTQTVSYKYTYTVHVFFFFLFFLLTNVCVEIMSFKLRIYYCKRFCQHYQPCNMRTVVFVCNSKWIPT